MENTTGSHSPCRVYLVGMMGAGKSTIARMLSQRLEWSWIDTDACVERNSCMTISEVFTLYGEEEFRRREWECVRQTRRYHDIVVACGGGAPYFHHAMEYMLSAGLVVFLSAKVDTLMNRLSQEGITRPLLTGIDISLEERLRLLLESREPVYRQAHVVIETDNTSEEKVVDMILAFINQMISQENSNPG